VHVGIRVTSEQEFVSIAHRGTRNSLDSLPILLLKVGWSDSLIDTVFSGY